MSEHVFAERAGGLQFIGDFEALYRAEPDPWGQSAQRGPMADYYRFSRGILVEALTRLKIEGEGVEIGCGHGHVTAELRRWFPHMEWAGVDVSERAIERARELRPHMTFHVADICALLQPQVQRFDVAILSQLLWYTLDRLGDAIANCRSILNDGGLLVVSQAFLKEQRYGKDIADGFHGTLRLLMERYPFLRLVEARYDDSGKYVHHDGLLIFRKVA